MFENVLFPRKMYFCLCYAAQWYKTLQVCGVTDIISRIRLTYHEKSIILCNQAIVYIVTWMMIGETFVEVVNFTIKFKLPHIAGVFLPIYHKTLELLVGGLQIIKKKSYEKIFEVRHLNSKELFFHTKHCILRTKQMVWYIFLTQTYPATDIIWIIADNHIVEKGYVRKPHLFIKVDNNITEVCAAMRVGEAWLA